MIVKSKIKRWLHFLTAAGGEGRGKERGRVEDRFVLE